MVLKVDFNLQSISLEYSYVPIRLILVSAMYQLNGLTASSVHKEADNVH